MANEIVGKAIQVVERYPDVFRATQFEAEFPGEPIPGIRWFQDWDMDAWMWCEEIAGTPSGKVARIETDVGDGRRIFWFDDMPSVRDVSVLGAVIPNTSSADAGIFARASDSERTAYFCGVYDGTFYIEKYLSGSSEEFLDIPFDYDPTKIVWIRLDTINATVIGGSSGVIVRAKAWQGNIEDEPKDFMLDVNDTIDTINIAGSVGIYCYSGETIVDFCYFRAKAILGDAWEYVHHSTPNDYMDKFPFEIIPDIVNIQYTPATLSLGENLGTRAQVVIEFTDHPHAEAGEFFNNGTYWGRYRARKLFHVGEPILLISGLVEQDVSEHETRLFHQVEFDGPTENNTFTITCQDILKLLDNEKSQAPFASPGALVSDLANNGMSFSVTEGTGDYYSESGYVAIGGKEIVAYTRSGDTFTITSRAQFGTTAIEHKAQDRVQECLYFSGDSPADILDTLLVDYAGVNHNYITYDDWVRECDTYLARQYSRVIAEPTSVQQLVEELIVQAGLVLWWDSRAEQIRLQVLRGIATDAYEYNEENIIAGSIQVMEERNNRLTEVWTYYGVHNPLNSLSDPSNFRSVQIYTNGEATISDGPEIKKIFGTWIPAFGASTAARTNALHVGRFLEPPRRVRFAVPRNTAIPVPEEAGGYRFRYRGNQSEMGTEINMPIQVIRVEPQTDRYVVEAEEMLFRQISIGGAFDPYDPFNRVITIDSNINNINLRQIHDSIYPPIKPDEISDVTVTFVIPSYTTIGSTSTDQPALNVGTWPAGVTPRIEIYGRVQGRGGNGGYNRAGFPGGTAIYTRNPVVIYYENGRIWGGGGGGGSSIWQGTVQGKPAIAIYGGGGGAGTLPGNKGSSDVTAATDTTGGTSTRAGDGGGPGQSGGSLASNLVFYSGGSAGLAIDGISYVTVDGTPGDIRGSTDN